MYLFFGGERGGGVSLSLFFLFVLFIIRGGKYSSVLGV